MSMLAWSGLRACSKPPVPSCLNYGKSMSILGTLAPMSRVPMAPARFVSTASRHRSLMVTRMSQLAFTRSSFYRTLPFQKYSTSSSSPAFESTISTPPPSEKAMPVPETTSKVVAYHLLASAALVFLIIIVGGITRLTESGLSITEWNPGLKGMRLPQTDEEWNEEWDKYKQSPREFFFGNGPIAFLVVLSVYFLLYPLLYSACAKG